VKGVAREAQVVYLPLYEAFRAEIEASPGRALTGFRFFPLYWDTVRFLLLRKSADEISRLNGWKFHVDGVHLNSRGGMIVADVIQEFLAG
jgi:hypothetical protein